MNVQVYYRGLIGELFSQRSSFRLEGKRYGHPHNEVFQRAADVGAAVFRTDELGTIEVMSDGQAIWWNAKR